MPDPAAPSFDPYGEWLRVPPGPHPPDHYALLGLARDEADPGTIRAAFRQRYELVRRYQIRWPALASRILDELSMASVVLTDAARKAEYDRTLPPTAPPRPGDPQRGDRARADTPAAAAPGGGYSVGIDLGTTN